jgi:hypothetical protein
MEITDKDILTELLKNKTYVSSEELSSFTAGVRFTEKWIRDYIDKQFKVNKYENTSENSNLLGTIEK